MNDITIRFTGLRRSGNHAVLNWIASLFDGEVCFINDANHQAEILPDQVSDPLPSLKGRPATTLDSRKALLLYSLEDIRLIEAARYTLPGEASQRARKSTNVLLLRDPYNTFASRLQMLRDRPANGFVRSFLIPDRDGRTQLRSLWKRYAREFLRRSSRLGPDLVAINYNRWRVDQPYRKQLAAALGGHYTEEHLHRVAAYGFGSSFDAHHFDAAASQMNLSERWKHFVGDDFFLSLIDDGELHDLSDEIFGPVIPDRPATLTRRLARLPMPKDPPRARLNHQEAIRQVFEDHASGFADSPILIETGCGKSTQALGELAAKLGGRAYSCDIDAGKIDRLKEKHRDSLTTVRFLAGDSLTTLREILTTFTEAIDFVLLDSAPSAHHTFQEFQLLESRLRPGACLLIDNAATQLTADLRSPCRKGKVVVEYLKASPHWKVLPKPDWGDSMVLALYHDLPVYPDISYTHPSLVRQSIA